MRELIFKNLTTQASKKRDISVKEVTERNGLVSSTTKRSIYFIRGIHKVKSKDELKSWLDKRKNDSNLNKKFFHILRNCSSKNKEDKLICKMRGSFCIISGNVIYNIVFIHSIRIQIHKSEKVG